MATSSLYQILINPFYYGKVRNGTNENWGTHEPMITQQEFEKVQRLLGREGKPKSESRDFSFTGIMKCGECSSAITAQEKVKYACPKCNVQLTARKPNSCRECGHKISSEVIKKGNWYIYYHCTKKKGKCAQKYVREEVLEEQITDNLKNIEIDPDFEEWAIEWMKYLHQENSHVNDKQLETLQKNYKRSQKRLDQLFEMRLDKEISPEEYEPKKKDFELAREELLQQINNLKENSDESAYAHSSSDMKLYSLLERKKNIRTLVHFFLETLGSVKGNSRFLLE